MVVYFDGDELAALNEKVRQSALSRESFIRASVSGQTVLAVPPVDVPKLVYEVRRVGITLNQLLALANARGLLDVPQLRRALEANRDMEKLVVAAYTARAG